MAAVAGDSGADQSLGEALRRFCRSIELCDDYLRGYYGLKLVRLLFIPTQEVLTRRRRPLDSWPTHRRDPGRPRRISDCQPPHPRRSSA